MKIKMTLKHGWRIIVEQVLAWNGTMEQLWNFEQILNASGELRCWVEMIEDDESDKAATTTDATAESKPQVVAGVETFPFYTNITNGGRMADVTIRCGKCRHVSTCAGATLPFLGARCHQCGEFIHNTEQEVPDLIRTGDPLDAQGDEFVD